MTVIDANMKLFADRMHITSSRMIRDYGLSTVDEIIEEEAKRGNKHVISVARDYYHSPEKLIKFFDLMNVENKFDLIYKMDDRTRAKLLPKLDEQDLLMGLYFFKQEKLLEMLLKVDIEELVNVVMEAMPLEQVIMMFTEDDLAMFFMNKDLPKEMVVEQMKLMPPEVMQKFVEGITGQPMEETNPMELINGIGQMTDDNFHKFMAMIDPDVQRQLTFQITKNDPEYLTLFSNETYVNMLSTLIKPDMVKPMIMLEQETLIKMVSKLPEDLLSVVASQVDAKELAKLLQHGHMDLIEEALMI